MSFATPREGYTSPHGGLPPLPPLPLSLLEECKKAGRVTPRGAASPRVSPITPRAPAPAPVAACELRAAALLSTAEAGAVEPKLLSLPPASPRQLTRLHSSEGLRSPLPEPRQHPVSVPLIGSRSGSGSGSWAPASVAVGVPSGAAPCSGRLTWRALLPANVSRDKLRVPMQMFVAVGVAALLFVFSKPHAFLHGKGLWTVITVILVLESTFGATLKKVKLRMVGTLVGGGLGGAIVAAANVINGGWQPKAGELDAVPKSLTVAFLVAAAAWFLEFGRLRDPNRECASLVPFALLCLNARLLTWPATMQMHTPWR